LPRLDCRRSKPAGRCRAAPVLHARLGSTLGSDGPAIPIACCQFGKFSRWLRSHRVQYHGSMGGSRAVVLAASAPRICRTFALLAQLVEHFHGKEGVSGSSPEEGSGPMSRDFVPSLRPWRGVDPGPTSTTRPPAAPVAPLSQPPRRRLRCLRCRCGRGGSARRRAPDCRPSWRSRRRSGGRASRRLCPHAERSP
jgi:hypothetical protein